MIDYKDLYEQSQFQVIKLKDQVKKLQNEIRQRCQSYLIHSSKYKSKTALEKGGNIVPQVDHQFTIQHQTINWQIESLKEGNEQNEDILRTETQQIPVINNFEKKIDDSGDQTQNWNQQLNGRQGCMQRIQSQTEQYQNQNSIVRQYQSQQIQNKGNGVSGGGGSYRNQVAQDNHYSEINWQDIVLGLKNRVGQYQKQKSELTQKVHNLQEQLVLCKKEMKKMIESGKPEFQEHYENEPEKVIENLENHENIISVEEQLQDLWEIVKNEVDFDSCTSLQSKINQVVMYIREMQRKLTKDQQKPATLQSGGGEPQYTYNTPYRKLKNNDSNHQHQQSDVYNERQFQLLKQKCLQLQAQLSKSDNKLKDTPESPQMQEDSYFLEEELQKPVDPYIKRSFVRRKVVKRNLSAMFVRSPCRSREQSKKLQMSQLEKLHDRLQKSKNSKNEKDVVSLSKQIEKLQRNIFENENPINQVSDDNSSMARTSGVSDQGFTQIIQVETSGPGFKNYSAQIMGVNKKEKGVHDYKRQ